MDLDDPRGTDRERQDASTDTTKIGSRSQIRTPAGDSLDAIFYDGDESGYSLSVDRVSPTMFLIACGCQAAPLAGDGGEWTVRFDADGQVVSVEPGLCWTS